MDYEEMKLELVREAIRNGAKPGSDANFRAQEMFEYIIGRGQYARDFAPGGGAQSGGITAGTVKPPFDDYVKE